MKLFEKGELGHLVGYNDELQSYRILSDNGRIVETSHVQFLEFKGKDRTSTNIDELLILENSNSISETSPSSPIVEDTSHQSPSLKPEVIQSDLSPVTSEKDSDSNDDDLEIEEALVLQQPSTSAPRTL
ncbi:hypothetical protein PGT21_033820 [Puccinia graminis f. sp. tritici]|uniref:Retroviral polymerase SH3-like domain-containing protein n=1 Tax=Puccinia graminis f. sp. tritici TaxID=56615 RepID=A0A5B0QPU9_PUCGR|nr:hypothetical protein PGT21_033820 [Puccinia graminis f. sp. tritici]